jgi:hypothetical protein
MLCLRYEPGGEDWCKTKEIGESYEAINTVFAFQLKWKLDADSRPLSPGRWAFIIIFSLISYQAITQLR